MSKRLYIGICAASCAVTIAAGWPRSAQNAENLEPYSITERGNVYIIRQGSEAIILTKPALYWHLRKDVKDFEDMRGLVRHCARPLAAVIYAMQDVEDYRLGVPYRKVRFLHTVRQVMS